MNEVTRGFCWHQNFAPWHCLPLTCGYIHLLSHEKMCLRSEVKRLFLNLQQMTIVMSPSCWHQNFAPWHCLPLTCGCIHLLSHEKMCIRSEVKRFFLNLQQMTIVMSPSCWHQNFGFNGLPATTLGLCLNFFSSITADFNISSALRWAIQNQWSSCWKKN